MSRVGRQTSAACTLSARPAIVPNSATSRGRMEDLRRIRHDQTAAAARVPRAVSSCRSLLGLDIDGRPRSRSGCTGANASDRAGQTRADAATLAGDYHERPRQTWRSGRTRRVVDVRGQRRPGAGRRGGGRRTHRRRADCTASRVHPQRADGVDDPRVRRDRLQLEPARRQVRQVGLHPRPGDARRCADGQRSADPARMPPAHRSSSDRARTR